MKILKYFGCTLIAFVLLAFNANTLVAQSEKKQVIKKVKKGKKGKRTKQIKNIQDPDLRAEIKSIESNPTLTRKQKDELMKEKRRVFRDRKNASKSNVKRRLKPNLLGKGGNAQKAEMKAQRMKDNLAIVEKRQNQSNEKLKQARTKIEQLKKDGKLTDEQYQDKIAQIEKVQSKLDGINNKVKAQKTKTLK